MLSSPLSSHQLPRKYSSWRGTGRITPSKQEQRQSASCVACSLVEQARRANADLPIIARAHSEAEEQHLTLLGATSTILGERELALEMLRKAGH